MVEPTIYPEKAPGIAQSVLDQMGDHKNAKQNKRFHLFTKPTKQQEFSKQPATKPVTKHPRAKQSVNHMERVNHAVNGQHVEFESLAYLEYGLQWFENLIHILAPRLLIVGFVLSMVDLLTRGSLLNTGFMVYTWAIIQAMAIDATLPNMWRLAFLRFDERRWVSGIVLLIVAVALAGVVLAALSIQFLQQSTGMDINRTMTHLGIDPNLLSYVRSIAVVALAAILSVLNRSKIAAAKPVRVNNSLNQKPTEQVNQEFTKPTEPETDKHEAVNTHSIPRKLHSVNREVNTGSLDTKLTKVTNLLLNSKLSGTEIAKQTGVSKGYVSQVRTKLNR